MKFTTVFATVAAFTGAASAAAIEMRDTCLAEYGVCYKPGQPSPSQACCDGLICVADRCRDPKKLTSCAAAPEPTCLAKYAVCYVAGGPQPDKACCDGLICAADRCRDPAEETIKPKPTTTATAEPTCLAKYATCFVAGGPQPDKGCCEGLICAADRCRDPKEEEIKPTPTATPEPTCLAKYATCYVAGGPQPDKACCEGLICAADRCRDPNEETAA